MRYPASEKLEIIHLVERSHLPVQRTLDKLGISTTTFYRRYDRYRAFNEAGLAVPAGSGTVSRTISAARSSSWPWMSRSCRHGNWR